MHFAKRTPLRFPLLAFAVSFFGFLLFYLIPFLMSAIYAFVDNPIRKNFVGLANFMVLLENGIFLRGLKNTVIFLMFAIPLCMVCSLLLALALKAVGRWGSLLSVIFLIPLVLPSAGVVRFWERMFAENGILNGWLDGMGIRPPGWLNSGFAMGVVIFLFLWKNLGYNAILFLTGLYGIPEGYYECAAVLGAGKRQQFFYITAVYLLPSFFLVFLMSFVNSFKIFREIYLLQGSFPHESIYLLQHYVNSTLLSMHYHRLVSAVYVLTFLISLVVLLTFWFETKIAEELRE